jgi:hypothetical protein
MYTTRFHDDAGMREVFRGDLPSVELARAVLEEAGIEAQIRWEGAGGLALSAVEAPLVPGRVTVLLVPSIAYDEARDVLAHFHEPEPDYPTELSEELRRTARTRKAVAAFILLLIFGPFVINLLRLLAMWLRGMFD